MYTSTVGYACLPSGVCNYSHLDYSSPEIAFFVRRGSQPCLAIYLTCYWEAPEVLPLLTGVPDNDQDTEQQLNDCGVV